MLWWLAVLVLGVLTLAAVQRYLQVRELERESARLHRFASQQVGQHDAHLTALSAIAVAGAGQRPDLFLDVAATISRFYPRIDEVQLVPLEPGGESVGSGALPPDVAGAIRHAAERSTGIPVLLPHPMKNGHYLVVKRSPNSDRAVYALALGIDAGRLIGSNAEFWSGKNVQVQLSLPDGRGLLASGDAILPQFAKPLDSTSQPLLLETSLQTRAADLFPPVRVAGVVFSVSLFFWLSRAVLGQRRRVRVAEREAEMRRMEAQLTHASRVNAMGEMASGMAHELTQPLTAILAQAQAGRRLLARGDTARLDPALEDIGAQARRASDILERLRNWSRPRREPIGVLDLRDALRNVRALLGPEAERRGVELHMDSQGAPLPVQADQVEMEQVLYNLVKNALEALEGRSDGQVRVETEMAGGHVVLNVSDNGPGVAEDLRPQLFTPFMTTREDGTGLGLALSQRLTERAGGEIAYVDEGAGATFRIVLPSALAAAEAAQ